METAAVNLEPRGAIMQRSTLRHPLLRIGLGVGVGAVAGVVLTVVTGNPVWIPVVGATGLAVAAVSRNRSTDTD